MPDFSRWGANGGDPSLNAIARTDRYLDALGTEQQVYATDPADAELANLMSGWRDEVRRPPVKGVAPQREAEIVLQRAVAARKRTRMSVAAVGSVAAARLCLGGFGAIVYGAGPGDALYGLRTALFGEQQVTRDDQVALAAQTEMQEVQQLIDQGNWTEAQDKLETVTSTVQTVEDPQRQQELQQQLNQLSVKVENRDPDATVPAAPGGPIAPNASIPLPIQPPTPEAPGLPLPGSGLPLPLPGSGLPLPLPLPGPGVPLPLPGSGLPLPLPGPVVPPDDSPPPILLPKPLPDDSKPLPKPGPAPKPAPDQPEPQSEEPKPAPKPALELPKPALELPKPVEPPKQIAPEVPAPKPAPVPEAPSAPVIGPAPAPKVPPALAPAPPQEEPPVEPTTTIWPIPAQKPKHGD